MTRRILLSVAIAALAANAFGRGGAPDWVKALAAAPAPKVPSDANGVLLLDETTTSVAASGEIRASRRQAWRILTTQGRELGVIALSSDSETRVTSLRGWTITASGEELPTRDTDVAETSSAAGELYSDARNIAMRLPAADPGSVIAIQYEYRGRPSALQDSWVFQYRVPAAVVRYTLTLPDGWSHDEKWFNSAGVAATRSGSAVTWEMRDVPAIHDEPNRPSDGAVAGQMRINFIPPGEQLAGKAHRTWDDVAKWYSGLASGRRASTPEIAAKAHELADGKASTIDKIAAIASFVQHDVRYVAVEIGVGGYQPHVAADVFRYRYGDCKDKVTLMSALLHEAGIASHYVLATTNRRTVDPQFATGAGFNHAVIAIPLDASAPKMAAVIDHPKLGKLLVFDPTDERTPVGRVPEYLQNNELLVVTPDGGALVHLAPSAPEENQLAVAAKFTLDADGTLRGAVTETRSGSIANGWRASLHNMNEHERLRALNRHVGYHIAHFDTSSFTIDNLDDDAKPLVFRYSLVAPAYAKPAGPLLLIRPRVLGEKGETIVDLKDRAYDYDTEGPSLQTDDFEIALPPGVAADELPPPIKAEAAGFRYASTTTADGNVIRYHRDYRVERFTVPRAELAEINKVFSAIMADERSSAVLKR